MTKLGRPKGKKDNNNNVFVGINMPKELATSLSKEANANFRMRSQHILWILTDYIVNNKPKLPVNKQHNQPLYTEEELEDMYKEHKENK